MTISILKEKWRKREGGSGAPRLITSSQHVERGNSNLSCSAWNMRETRKDTNIFIYLLYYKISLKVWC